MIRHLGVSDKSWKNIVEKRKLLTDYCLLLWQKMFVSTINKVLILHHLKSKQYLCEFLNFLY